MSSAAYVVPGWLTTGASLILLAGLLLGVGFGVRARPGSRRARACERALGAALGAGIVFTVVHAGAEDSYFGDGTTYWEWGGVNRSLTVVGVAVAAVALGLIVAIRLLAPDRVWLRRAGFTLGGASCGILLVALVAISIGH